MKNAIVAREIQILPCCVADSQARDRGSNVARKIGSSNESDVSEVGSSELRTSDEGVRGKPGENRNPAREKSEEGGRRWGQTLYTREITCFVNSAAVTNGYSGGIEWRNGRSTSARTSSPSGMHCSSLYQRRHGRWNLRISRLRPAQATHPLPSSCHPRGYTRREIASKHVQSLDETRARARVKTRRLRCRQCTGGPTRNWFSRWQTMGNRHWTYATDTASV